MLFRSILVALGSVISGLVFGVYAGYKGGRTDESMMRFNDIIYALPVLPFLIILSVTTSSSIFLMIGFLTMFGWVGIAKVSRSMALQIKTRQFVVAAKTMGQKDIKIIFKHIIPQIMPYALASIAISVPAAITTEAGLSFLGLGAQPPIPSWGEMINAHRGYILMDKAYLAFIPGFAIMMLVLSFILVGNGLRDALDAKAIEGKSI